MPSSTGRVLPFERSRPTVRRDCLPDLTPQFFYEAAVPDPFTPFRGRCPRMPEPESRSSEVDLTIPFFDKEGLRAIPGSLAGAWGLL